jgi:16S rRNA (cytosine1402-N4)-methyltransferase
MTFSSTPTDEVLTAKDVVNDWSEESLADIFFGYADERYARRIARAIVEARSHHTIATTYQLVDVIASAVPAAYRHSKTHFATKVFQALRMAVNDELGSVQELINSLPEVLTRDGRACFITFHSTEDRIVKQAIRENLSLSLVYKKAIMPTPLECSHNPRARSAQLRVAHLKSIHE